MQLKMVNSHKKKRTPFTNNNWTILPVDGKKQELPAYQVELAQVEAEIEKLLDTLTRLILSF